MPVAEACPLIEEPCQFEGGIEVREFGEYICRQGGVRNGFNLARNASRHCHAVVLLARGGYAKCFRQSTGAGGLAGDRAGADFWFV